MAEAARTYTAKDIKTLKGPETARKRPSMYIGSIDDDGVLVCIREITDNCVDEAMEGYGTRILIVVDSATGWVTITDFGRGIPVDLMEDGKTPAVLEILTNLHSGGKFEEAYSASSGLNGVGATVVNFLSEEFRVEINRDGKAHQIAFQKGALKSKLKSVELPAKSKKLTGTSISYRLDASIFTQATRMVPAEEDLVRMLRDKAYLNPGVSFELTYDGRQAGKFRFPDGLRQMTASMRPSDKESVSSIFAATSDKAAHDRARAAYKAWQAAPKETRGDNPGDPVWVDVAASWDAGYGSDVRSYCNSVHQAEGGTHATGLRMAIGRSVIGYITDKKLIPTKDRDLKVETADCLEGCRAVVAIRHTAPIYKGQTKHSLANPDAQAAVLALVQEKLELWLDTNPKDARAVAKKAVDAARAREAARAARQAARKQAEVGSGMKNSGKLAACSSRDPEECELFIVEGDSAGGSAKQGRDRRVQAIYPLKGKPLNTYGKGADKILFNVEVNDLCAALGLAPIGHDATEDEKDAWIGRLKYHKIVNMSDADIDGSHIDCLLMTFFFTHMRPLIERGHVYLAKPPLFKITRGKTKTYAVTTGDLAKVLAANAVEGLTGLKTRGKAVDRDVVEALGATARDILKREQLLAGGAGMTPKDLGRLCTAVWAATGRDGLESEDPRWQDEAYYAAALEALCTAQSCEAVGVSDAGGFLTVSGLDPMEGRYFTIKVDGEAVKAANDLIEWLSDRLADLSGVSISDADTLLDRLLSIDSSDSGPCDLHRAAEQADRESTRGISVTRMKGLGEMEATELWETTLDPARRVLSQVTVTDFSAAGKLVTDLMDQGDSEPRKALIRGIEAGTVSIDA